MNKPKEFFSTGEAALLFSVTADTVLKWVKSGKLQATRTPGGHYRIPRSQLPRDLFPEPIPSRAPKPKLPFQYCWEFKSVGGKILEGCLRCIVYRSRTRRCYEMSHLPAEAGHSRLFCSRSCEECDYYRLVKGQRANVLIVTNRNSLRRRLETHASRVNYNMAFTDCEYQCSMIVESYRPDFVVLDCRMGVERSREFARNIAQDPRIPFARVILAGEVYEFPQECDREVFAFINHTFSAFELEELIQNLKST